MEEGQQDQDPILDIMPFLNKLLLFESKTRIVEEQIKNILSIFRAMAIYEGDHIKNYEDTAKMIENEIEGTGLSEFLPFDKHYNSGRLLILNKKEQLQIMVDTYINLSKLFEELSEKKKEIIKIPIVKSISTEEKIKFIEGVKEDIQFFYDTMMNKRVPPIKIRDAKEEFIRDYAGNDQTKILILEEEMLNYENKIEDNNKRKDKKKDKM